MGRTSTRIVTWALLLAVGRASPAPAADGPPSERASRKVVPARPTKVDNATFRPTVKIRQGPSAGSGTIVASAKGEALILTAAHVVGGEGEISVELHRYNLGLELAQPQVGWPRSFPAEVVQADPEADVALLRLPGLGKLPFVARLVEAADEPRPGEHVRSFGIDRGENLNRWDTTVRGLLRLDRGDGKARPFLVTERAPEHGRSGGGLFRDDGRVIGVCVGRIDMAGGRAVGLFASPSSVRKLLGEPAAAAAIARHPALLPAADRGGAPAR